MEVKREVEITREAILVRCGNAKAVSIDEKAAANKAFLLTGIVYICGWREMDMKKLELALKNLMSEPAELNRTLAMVWTGRKGRDNRTWMERVKNMKRG
jgi:hypothetical protein